jgi:DNA-binding MarR family transcriptional regulator
MPTRRALSPVDPTAPEPTLIDLDRYVPAYLAWIANKLSRGASQHYLNAFDVGIETWRCMVLLAVEGSVSAQRISKVIGMDKASVSRCFKGMLADGLIVLELDDSDGRLRMAKLTKKGRELHDRIVGVALERERAFLSVLTPKEQDTLLDLLKRLHENLPQVDSATERYVAQNVTPTTKRRRHGSAPADE